MDPLTILILAVIAVAVFYLVPAALLWRRRHEIPFEWALATAVALALVPGFGMLFAWYVVTRRFPVAGHG
jgi:hypothetical protein